MAIMSRATLLLLSLFSLTHANQETLIGITGRDFVLLAADSSISGQGSISWQSHKVDKIRLLQGGVAAASAGDVADSDRLLQMLQAHCAIREWEVGMGSDVEYILADGENEPPTTEGLSVDSVAHLARHQISQSLRSRGPMNVCLLIAGMSQEAMEETDTSHFTKRLQRQVQQATNAQVETAPSRRSTTTTDQQPRLFWLDQYGSLQKLHYGAHGYAANFLLSILDQGYRPDMTREEAIDLIKSCFQQLRVRYIINSPQPPCIKCIDADGCHLIDVTS